MHQKSFRFTRFILLFFLILFVSACDSSVNQKTGKTSTPLPGSSPAAGPSTTAPMPPTQTACPADGTARAAVMAPLALGNHQNLVYVFNQEYSRSNMSGIIRRFDVSTSNKVDIVNNPTSSIFEAQVSEDGQWVLFTAMISGETAIQLVRMDGQGLQTLHCSSQNIASVQWSFDQKTVVFTEGPNGDLGAASTYLLDMASGALKVVLLPGTGTGIGMAPAAWLDNTHIYMTSFIPNSGAPPQGLYVLDTAKGTNQHTTDLQKIFDNSGICLSFDRSFDGTRLFVSQCTADFGAGTLGRKEGPSSIMTLPPLGGASVTTYSTSTQAIDSIRVVNATTLLMTINNLTGDTSANGLWKMNLDGTNLTRLTTADTGQMTSLCTFSQYIWSNLSRDGSSYAVRLSSGALQIGALNGGSPSTIASFSGDQYQIVDVVGWTSL